MRPDDRRRISSHWRWPEAGSPELGFMDRQVLLRTTWIDPGRRRVRQGGERDAPLGGGHNFCTRARGFRLCPFAQGAITRRRERWRLHRDDDAHH